MIPVDQKTKHDPKNNKFGDCLSATLASLLHLSIDDVPVFKGNNEDGSQFIEANAWLKKYGLALICIGANADHLKSIGVSGLWCGTVGTSPRFKDSLHATVGLDGIVAHDPHPDKTGLPDGVTALDVLVVLEPWKMIEFMQHQVQKDES